MGELMEYVKERYAKNDRSDTKDMMDKQRIKNSILAVCDEYIKDDSSLIFEVLPSGLQYAVAVVTEEPLRSKYDIVQISDTLFAASLKSVEI